MSQRLGTLVWACPPLPFLHRRVCQGAGSWGKENSVQCRSVQSKKYNLPGILIKWVFFFPYPLQETSRLFSHSAACVCLSLKIPYCAVNFSHFSPSSPYFLFRVSFCSPGWSWICGDSPVSASQVLGFTDVGRHTWQTFTFVCVCAHVHVDVCVCMCVCKPEVNLRCLPLISLHLIWGDRTSHWTWSSLILLDWLPSES